MTARGQWRVERPIDFASHEFPDGIVLYDLQYRSTKYLPHPAGGVFSVLKCNLQGLDDVHILDAMAHLGAASLVTAEELESVLAELERINLITVSA